MGDLQKQHEVKQENYNQEEGWLVEAILAAT
jgi:hypothetical protein